MADAGRSFKAAVEGGNGMLSIQLTVNGDAHTVSIEPAETLLHVLREKLGLTGTKEGCGEGDCGCGCH